MNVVKFFEASVEMKWKINFIIHPSISHLYSVRDLWKFKRGKVKLHNIIYNTVRCLHMSKKRVFIQVDWTKERMKTAQSNFLPLISISTCVIYSFSLILYTSLHPLLTDFFLLFCSFRFVYTNITFEEIFIYFLTHGHQQFYFFITERVLLLILEVEVKWEDLKKFWVLLFFSSF